MSNYLMQKDLRIGKSTIHNAGYGVFANEDIIKDEIVCISPLLKVSSGFREEYIFISDAIYFAMGFGSVFNHSDTPNAICKIENKLLNIIANNSISKGAEIFIDYGKDYNRNYFNNSNTQ